MPQALIQLFDGHCRAFLSVEPWDFAKMFTNVKCSWLKKKWLL